MFQRQHNFPMRAPHFNQKFARSQTLPFSVCQKKKKGAKPRKMSIVHVNFPMRAPHFSRSSPGAKHHFFICQKKKGANHAKFQLFRTGICAECSSFQSEVVRRKSGGREGATTQFPHSGPHQYSLLPFSICQKKQKKGGGGGKPRKISIVYC